MSKGEKENAPANEGTIPAHASPAPTPASFAEVVQEHWVAVFRLLYTLTGNSHDTEDLTQETFLKALDRLSTFQPNTQMRAWLLRIATNTFLDLQRKRHRLKMHSLDSEPPAAEKAPQHRLEMTEQSKLVQVVLEQLSEMTRMVFHLRVQEELSFREIAAIVGTTEQGARWHMHQARSKLLERLGERE